MKLTKKVFRDCYVWEGLESKHLKMLQLGLQMLPNRQQDESIVILEVALELLEILETKEIS